MFQLQKVNLSWRQLPQTFPATDGLSAHRHWHNKHDHFGAVCKKKQIQEQFEKQLSSKREKSYQENDGDENVGKKTQRLLAQGGKLGGG